MQVLSNSRDTSVGCGSNFDMKKAVKEFEETKAGVKGLVDSGVVKIPRIFIQPPEKLPSSKSGATPDVHLQLPVIDLQGSESGRRVEIVDEIRKASETWGFFQIVNHGMPASIMNQMLGGIRRFHEQTWEEKKDLYTRDERKKLRYHCDADHYVTRPVSWRDTLACDFLDDTLKPELLPRACRKEIDEYRRCMLGVREKLSELLSEALGLPSGHLSSMECMKCELLLCHYYPPCPEPDLTIGAASHTDPCFLTVLLQDNIGGLQVRHQDHWIDVPPMQGALVVNIGDMLQLISNGKFKSSKHRVLAGRVGPRISVSGFHYPSPRTICQPFGPLQELLSDTDQPIYRETSVGDYMERYKRSGLDYASALQHFKQGSS